MASSRAITMSALTRAAPVAARAAVASRALSTASRTPVRSATRPTLAVKLDASTRLAFRRAYADEAPRPKPKVGKIRKTFRWMWRITYLSTAGLVGYVCYEIYQDRHPEPQYEPDSSKKTLVILGELAAETIVISPLTTEL